MKQIRLFNIDKASAFFLNFPLWCTKTILWVFFHHLFLATRAFSTIGAFMTAYKIGKPFLYYLFRWRRVRIVLTKPNVKSVRGTELESTLQSHFGTQLSGQQSGNITQSDHKCNSELASFWRPYFITYLEKGQKINSDLYEVQLVHLKERIVITAICEEKRVLFYRVTGRWEKYMNFTGYRTHSTRQIWLVEIFCMLLKNADRIEIWIKWRGATDSYFAVKNKSCKKVLKNKHWNDLKWNYVYK